MIKLLNLANDTLTDSWLWILPSRMDLSAVCVSLALEFLLDEVNPSVRSLYVHTQFLLPCAPADLIGFGGYKCHMI